MTQIIVLLILSICLAVLVLFLFFCYSDYRQAKQDSDKFNRLMRDQFELSERSMAAYEAMLREACRTLGDDDNGSY